MNKDKLIKINTFVRTIGLILFVGAPLTTVAMYLLGIEQYIPIRLFQWFLVIGFGTFLWDEEDLKGKELRERHDRAMLRLINELEKQGAIKQ